MQEFWVQIWAWSQMLPSTGYNNHGHLLSDDYMPGTVILFTWIKAFDLTTVHG